MDILRAACKVVLYLSSTSNHNLRAATAEEKQLCYIFLLHQTTTKDSVVFHLNGCVISFFYIKPQPPSRQRVCRKVVLYLSSTSNHNKIRIEYARAYVVLYLSSTSNHNAYASNLRASLLCYIFLLHQTTTGSLLVFINSALCYIFLLHQTTTRPQILLWRALLCYIFLLHQTTTGVGQALSGDGCVISFFYIKPQRQREYAKTRRSCVISFFYIKPQQAPPLSAPPMGCVISFFYIKPQLLECEGKTNRSCVISFFYIKPQQSTEAGVLTNGCVISFFYIKPQRPFSRFTDRWVVLYLSSTSNHNARAFAVEGTVVVLYLSSTSNHNQSFPLNFSDLVVLYLSSTSNHN